MYENGFFSYVLNSGEIKSGKIIKSKLIKNLDIGNFVQLHQIPYGMPFYNIETKLGSGGQFARAAGTFAIILNKFYTKFNKILIQLKSGEEYLINKNCFVTLGSVSNASYWFRSKKKANMNRKLGFRSKVRGIAMNPVDHPHGGRTNGGILLFLLMDYWQKGKKHEKKK